MVIREIQIRNTLSCHFIPIKMAIIKKETTTTTTNIGEDMEKLEHLHTTG